MPKKVKKDVFRWLNVRQDSISYLPIMHTDAVGDYMHNDDVVVVLQDKVTKMSRQVWVEGKLVAGGTKRLGFVVNLRASMPTPPGYDPPAGPIDPKRIFGPNDQVLITVGSTTPDPMAPEIDVSPYND